MIAELKELKSEHYNSLIKNNCIITIETLLKEGAEFDAHSMNTAIIHNNMNVVQLLRSYKIPFDSYSMLYAADNEDVSMVYYLEKEGCDFMSMAIKRLSRTSNLELFKIAHKHLDYVNDNVIKYHIKKDNKEILEYIDGHFPDTKDRIPNILKEHKYNLYPDMIKYLDDFGVVFTDDNLKLAIIHNNLGSTQTFYDLGMFINCNYVKISRSTEMTSLLVEILQDQYYKIKLRDIVKSMGNPIKESAIIGDSDMIKIACDLKIDIDENDIDAILTNNHPMIEYLYHKHPDKKKLIVDRILVTEKYDAIKYIK